jgi:HSP20 family molecular chaperone IbpA
MDSRCFASSKIKLTEPRTGNEKAMNVNLSFQKNFTVRNSQNTSQLRRIFVSRLEASMTAFMTQIERWPDKNYVPEELDYVCNQTLESYEIIAPLHGFKAHDVRVDLSHGHVIILLSHEYDTTSSSQKEYYCEVPIPADAKGNAATIEISANVLTVRLNKKSRVFNRISAVSRRLKKISHCFWGETGILARWTTSQCEKLR